MTPCLVLVCCASTCLGTPWFEGFQSAAPGTFPGGRWRDMGQSAVPMPTLPTGEVINTLGPAGDPTRAFQVFQRQSTSQGIITDIDLAPRHRLEADLRVDINPSPIRFGNWTAGMGFFQEEDPATDINFEPQGVVYVYASRWWFYGATNLGGPTNLEIGPAPVRRGEWYHIAIDVNTLTGAFDIEVLDAAGATLIDRTITIAGFDPSRGQYNRVAIFDGEYAAGAVTPGQFTADNIRYVPGPGGAAALLAFAFGARRRRPLAWR